MLDVVEALEAERDPRAQLLRADLEGGSPTKTAIAAWIGRELADTPDVEVRHGLVRMTLTRDNAGALQLLLDGPAAAYLDDLILEGTGEQVEAWLETLCTAKHV